MNVSAVEWSGERKNRGGKREERSEMIRRMGERRWVGWSER